MPYFSKRATSTVRPAPSTSVTETFAHTRPRIITTRGTPSSPRTLEITSPHLAALADLHDCGGLNEIQKAAAERVAQFHLHARGQPLNLDVVQEDQRPQNGVSTFSKTRRASFMLSADILNDVAGLIDRIDTAPAGSGTRPRRAAQPARRVDLADATLLKASLEALQQNCKLQQNHALADAYTGRRMVPLTLLPHEFSIFLGKNSRLLTSIAGACELSGQPRITALETKLTELAHRYCLAAQILPPTDRLRVRLVARGDNGVYAGAIDHNGLRDLGIQIATDGVDTPNTSITGIMRRRGLGNFMHGFDSASLSTRQAAAYLQVFFHQMTRLEEITLHAPGGTRLTTGAQASLREQDYAGDLPLGDAPGQRRAALEPILRLAEAMQNLQSPYDSLRSAGAAATSAGAAAAIDDPGLRRWLEQHQAERDLAALADPGSRLAVVQEESTRKALMRSLTFRSAA